MRVTKFVTLFCVERILYGDHGHSSGAMVSAPVILPYTASLSDVCPFCHIVTQHRLLARESLSQTVLALKKCSIVQQIVTQAEFQLILSTFQETLPIESCGRVRMCSLLPLPVAISAAQAFGRSGQAIQFMQCFQYPIPRLWQLQTEKEENDRELVEDFVLNEEIQELEEADVALQAELHSSFILYEEKEEDEVISRSYTLDRVPKVLEELFQEYSEYRMAPLNRMRSGSAVVELTSQHDVSICKRFLGFLLKEHEVPPNLVSILGAPNLGERAQSFLDFLSGRSVQYSTMANYLTGIINVTSWVWETKNVDAEAVKMNPDPPSQLLNLRGQCESHSKQDALWKRKDPNWIDFETAQKARVDAINAHLSYTGSEHKKRLQLLRDVLILSFLTCQPPDSKPIALEQPSLP